MQVENESRIWRSGGRIFVFFFFFFILLSLSVAAPKGIYSEFIVMEVFSFSLNQHRESQLQYDNLTKREVKSRHPHSNDNSCCLQFLININLFLYVW